MSDTFKIPAHITNKDSRAWGKKLHDEVDLSDAPGQLLLITALEAHQRMSQARQLLDKQGLTIKDRYGKPKLNPVCQIEKESRNSLVMCLRALNVDPSLTPKG